MRQQYDIKTGLSNNIVRWDVIKALQQSIKTTSKPVTDRLKYLSFTGYSRYSYQVALQIDSI